MSDKTLFLLAIMRAKAGREREMREILETLIEPTQDEPGCLYYEMHTNDSDPREFVFWEEWKTAADLDAHTKTDHFVAAFAKLPELMESEMVARRLTKVG
jgi:quinol monooxygenase YgiN